MMGNRYYIAGPMRGIPLYNFPAFDKAEERLRAAGLEPVNPAALDREAGITADTYPLPENFMREAMKRDLAAICDCYGLALLPGWDSSEGATIEVYLAKMLGLKLIDAETLLRVDETILDEAKRLTRGVRQGDYGHPHEDFSRTSALWAAILGVEVTPRQVALCMIQVKVARLIHRSKRDSWVDIAGYADTGQRVDEYTN